MSWSLGLRPTSRISCNRRTQLNHYILGVLSLDMARDIHYGDKACYAKNASNSKLVAVCTGISDGEK